MAKVNSVRKNCKDSFNAFLVTTAQYCGSYEFPVIWPTYDIPERLVCFSKAKGCMDCKQWVHFFEEDYQFERIWRNPLKYIALLKRFEGVILPDFSVYRDMPFSMQLWNIYRSRAIGNWLQQNGVKVIPNIRYGDWRTYHCCCDGVSEGCVIAVGTHGTLKNKVDREIFTEGLGVVISRLNPSAMAVYGTAPASIFQKYEDRGIKIVSFKSDYAMSHSEVV